MRLLPCASVQEGTHQRYIYIRAVRLVLSMECLLMIQALSLSTMFFVTVAQTSGFV